MKIENPSQLTNVEYSHIRPIFINSSSYNNYNNAKQFCHSVHFLTESKYPSDLVTQVIHLVSYEVMDRMGFIKQSEKIE